MLRFWNGIAKVDYSIPSFKRLMTSENAGISFCRICFRPFRASIDHGLSAEFNDRLGFK
jgi:hypothetical protein